MKCGGKEERNERGIVSKGTEVDGCKCNMQQPAFIATFVASFIVTGCKIM